MHAPPPPPSRAAATRAADLSTRILALVQNREADCATQHHVGGTHKFGEEDGAWDVCYDRLAPPCVVYSFGIADDWSFDKALADFGCEVHSFDPSIGMDDHDPAKNVHFHNMGAPLRFPAHIGQANAPHPRAALRGQRPLPGRRDGVWPGPDVESADVGQHHARTGCAGALHSPGEKGPAAALTPASGPAFPFPTSTASPT